MQVLRCNGNNILAESAGQEQNGGESSDDEDAPWLPRGLEFLSGLPMYKRKRRVIVVIQSFLDDSGVKGTHPIFTFAGFIGRAEKWAKFSDEWIRWLHSEPRIGYLKMNEAVKLNGEFRGFTKEERNDKLRGCISILKEYPQQAIQISVNVADYESNLAKKTAKSARNPYFLAFFGILSGVCYEMADTGVPDQIEIIFDEHSIFKPRIDYWYERIRKDIGALHDPVLARVLPPNPIFKSDLEFVPLQAADVLAWLFRNAYSGIRNEFEWIAEELSAVIPMSYYATLYDAERMKNVIQLTEEIVKKITPEMIAANKRDPRWKAMTRMESSKEMKRRIASEFENFDRAMHALIKVPHEEIKEQLDIEKAAKKKKRKPKTSASGHVSGDRD